MTWSWTVEALEYWAQDLYPVGNEELIEISDESLGVIRTLHQENYLDGGA